MSVLYIALPIALVIAAVAVITFVLLVRNGQYDDLDTPPHRMLLDDDEINKRTGRQKMTGQAQKK